MKANSDAPPYSHRVLKWATSPWLICLLLNFFYQNIRNHAVTSKTIRARVQATRERQVEPFLQIGLCLGIFPDASDDGGEPLLRAGKEYIRAER